MEVEIRGVRLRCGLLSPGDGAEVAHAVTRGLVKNGCEVEVLSADTEWRLANHDFILAYGPMRSISWAVMRLVALRSAAPPVIVWFTEQVPRPDQPRLLTRVAAQLRYALETAICKSSGLNILGRDLRKAVGDRAGRLRALGELLALDRAGILNRVCVFTESNNLFLRSHGLPVATIPMVRPNFWRGPRANS